MLVVCGVLWCKYLRVAVKKKLKQNESRTSQKVEQLPAAASDLSAEK